MEEDRCGRPPSDTLRRCGGGAVPLFTDMKRTVLARRFSSESDVAPVGLFLLRFKQPKVIRHNSRLESCRVTLFHVSW